MKHVQIRGQSSFKVVAKTARSQAAEMVIDPGDAEGGPDNTHPSDQWLYVTGGSGLAIVNGRKVSLKKGSLLLIERGDRHEIRNTGRTSLTTLNVYAPPAY